MIARFAVFWGLFCFPCQIEARWGLSNLAKSRRLCAQWQHFSGCLGFIFLFLEDENKPNCLSLFHNSSPSLGEHGFGSSGGCAPFVYLHAELPDWKLLLLCNGSYLPSSWARQELCAQAAALGWRRCWKHPSTGCLQTCTYICNAVSWFWLGWSSFPVAAHIVLCSPYLAGTVLILHQCFVCALMATKLSPLPQGQQAGG